MFEGVIPEGYGAGIVMLWDYGTWEPESEDVDAALRKGDLKFRLNGYKLKGSWVIVKTHGFGGAPNSWLLIKHRDDWAGPINITEFAPLSVKTPDADFAEILSGKTPDLWLSNAPAKGGDTGAMFKKIIERAMSMKAPAKAKAATKDTKNKTTKDTKNKTAKAERRKPTQSRDASVQRNRRIGYAIRSATAATAPTTPRTTAAGDRGARFPIARNRRPPLRCRRRGRRAATDVCARRRTRSIASCDGCPWLAITTSTLRPIVWLTQATSSAAVKPRMPSPFGEQVADDDDRSLDAGEHLGDAVDEQRRHQAGEEAARTDHHRVELRDRACAPRDESAPAARARRA